MFYVRVVVVVVAVAVVLNKIPGLCDTGFWVLFF